MSDEPQRQARIIGRDDVIVRRYIFDDGTIRLKVSGPKFANATPEDTMEFLINAVGFVARVVAKYRDDLKGDEVVEHVKQSIEDALEDHEMDTFQVVWPRSDKDGPMPPLRPIT